MLALKHSPLDLYAYQIIDIQYLSINTICLTLQAKNGTGMVYQSGQFLSISLPDNDFRCYSMASPYLSSGSITLHIRLYASGKFSNYLTTQLRKGDVLHLQGPFGNCVWPVDICKIKQTIMLATGTGIAPIKAIIEEVVHLSTPHTITLLYGGNTKDDIYLYAFFSDLAERYPHFHFIPVLNAAPSWHRNTGLIQDVAAQLWPDMSAVQVFACGSAAMVNAAKAMFTEKCHLFAHHFYADAFEIAQPLSAMCIERSLETIRVNAKYPDGTSLDLNLNVGLSLMAALQENEVMRGICGGKAMCGTCCITLEDTWLNKLPPVGRSEKRLLQTLTTSHKNSRLACQIKLESCMHGLAFSVVANQI